jgi:hypothetical protein
MGKPMSNSKAGVVTVFAGWPNLSDFIEQPPFSWATLNRTLAGKFDRKTPLSSVFPMLTGKNMDWSIQKFFNCGALSILLPLES